MAQRCVASQFENFVKIKAKHFIVEFVLLVDLNERASWYRRVKLAQFLVLFIVIVDGTDHFSIDPLHLNIG